MRLLLIAHGSRDPRYAASFEALCLRLRGAGHSARAGHLDLCGPDVIEAATLLAREAPGGCAEPITAVPMFLNHGYHVTHDVPGAVATARAALGARARIVVSAPLGPDPLLTEAMESRLREIGVWPGDPETAVVLASAGSSDPAARGTLQALAGRWARSGWHGVIPAYAAAAGPGAAEAVARARAAGARNVVIATPENVDPVLVRLVLRRAGEAAGAGRALAPPAGHTSHLSAARSRTVPLGGGALHR
jgi:sirohydrochlorin ferrochelatase